MNAPTAAPAVIRLASDRLAVSIAVPDSARGARFDATASICQVVLDGRHAFCGIEDGGTLGVGLCAEFGIRGPIGYDDARPGEAFLKPGVGALTRGDDQPYDFARAYAVAPSPIAVSGGDDEALFTAAPLVARGWGVSLVRRVRVAGDRLEIESTLGNVGERAFAVEEYNHNFLASGGGTHELILDGAIDATPAAWFARDGARLAWPTPVRVPRYLTGPARDATTWSWRDPSSGRAVSETCSEPWSRFALFTTPSLVCPEAFVHIALAPGESATWRRTWTFSVA